MRQTKEAIVCKEEIQQLEEFVIVVVIVVRHEEPTVERPANRGQQGASIPAKEGCSD
jgi:hypothetical protein